MTDPIPLQDAVAQGLIRCAACGATGAGVREVGGRKHFLCEGCVRRSRAWRGAIAGLSVAVALVLAVLIARAGNRPPAAPGGREAETVLAVQKLIDSRRPQEALALLAPALEAWPRMAELQFLQGRALFDLGYEEEAVPFLRSAAGAGNAPEECGLWLGHALARTDRAAEALPLLEREIRDPALREKRNGLRADCLLELFRNEDALKVFEGVAPSRDIVRIRGRALWALGRDAEAEKELDSLPAPDAAFKSNLRAAALREAGDFAAALRAVEAGLAAATEGQWFPLKRSEATVHLEAGDAVRAVSSAQALASRGSGAYRGEGLWARMLGHLQAGDREQALAAAREFKAQTDPRLSALRHPRLMVRHLLGEAKDGDVEAEAKATSPVRANDLYYYLALATGRKDWAEKALAATPGRNFPHHAIRRLLGK